MSKNREQYNKNFYIKKEMSKGLTIKDSPAERYKNLDIWVTEDRFLANSKV